MNLMITSESLQKLRRDVGLTQSELAIEVGVSQSYIARLERGTFDPKLSVANKIIEVLSSRGRKTCADIMTSDPITVDARDPASEAVAVMQRHNFSQVPVLRGTQMIGMVTERDIIRNLEHDMKELSVQAVMSPEGIPIIDETTPLEVITPLFQNYQAILVHNQGRIRGIITRSDLLKLT
ncbi:CBS domain-containing protein [Candidatus Thorarchaeota archaeon]|nr:MAG: CBS domain-containing protein [Candidatus Thorarchaeota archaeon]